MTADLNQSRPIEEMASEDSYEKRVALCTEIAKPMASKKTLTRIRKLIQKGRYAYLNLHNYELKLILNLM